MLGNVYIKRYEVGLYFLDGDFKRLLPPGSHYLLRKLLSPYRAKVEIANTLRSRFVHPLLDVLVKEPDLAAALEVVDLSDEQRALVWRENRLDSILGPGRYALWRKPFELRVETFSIDEVRFTHPNLEVILTHGQASEWLDVVNVEAWEDVLMFRDGALVERLGEGRYAFWKGAARLAWKAVDRREQTIEVSGQEIMTRDKVTLRLNLLVTYRVADPVKSVTLVAEPVQSLYREAQLALRAAVGTRNLDAILEEKEAAGSEIRGALARRADEFGIEVRSIGLKDIILPGEMKAILNQVIAAEKQAQANFILRREETAAARSQANTARLLADNPVLARMKELEALQEILAGAKATFVLGDGDIVERLRGLVASQEPMRKGG